jgi:hypothetical protein
MQEIDLKSWEDFKERLQGLENERRLHFRDREL